MKKKVDSREDFYREVLGAIESRGVPFMVGGAFALHEYAGIHRDTKDLDIFCKPGDYQNLLQCLLDLGYETEITDANWLAKVRRGPNLVDVIFSSANNVCLVDDEWLEQARRCTLFGLEVKLVPVEELLWSKAFVQDRARFDGADVHHLIRGQGRCMDWRRLLSRMDQYWEVLLQQVMGFRFVYPSERDAVPRWVMEELLKRASQQLDLPAPRDRICRGPLLSRTQYDVDITEWGYEWGYKQT